MQGETRSEVVSNVKALQKEAARRIRKRRRLFDEEVSKKQGTSRQTRLMRFGIVQYKKQARVSFSFSIIISAIFCCFLFPLFAIDVARERKKFQVRI